MRPCIVIRKSTKQDDIEVQNLIRDYVMSNFKAAFYFVIFREITLQLIVLFWAILFIFLGIPLFMCFVAIPGVVVLIFVGVYTTYYNKAAEISNANPKLCWVAELYEPFVLRSNPMEMEYEFYEDKNKIDESDLNRMRRKLVGTVASKNHHAMENSCWVHRLAVLPGYPFDKIAQKLVTKVIHHACENNLYSCETVTSECHEGPREMLLKLGFSIRQIYHKQIIGTTLRIMKAQMGLDLDTYFEDQKNGKDLLRKESY